MKPTIPITDPRFVYRSAIHTNLHETFRKAREAMKQSEPVRDHVVAMRKRTGK